MPLYQLANKLILRPSTHPVESAGGSRLLLPFEGGDLEVFVHRVGAGSADDVQLYLLKFVGNAGRAERAGSQPADFWGLPAEVWSVNMPGYGGSTGPAGLRRVAPAARAVFDALAQTAAGRPIVVAGNSLGTAAALYLAGQHPVAGEHRVAQQRVAGLILRNPVPLSQLIVGRHGWWTLWLPAMLLAAQVPGELASVRNAARAAAPALFITSGADRLVPPRFQEKITSAYAGEKRLFTLAGLDHHTPMTAEHERDYAGHLAWLLGRVLDAEPTRVSAPRASHRA